MRNVIFALGVCLFFFVLQSRGQEQRLLIPFYGLHFDGGIQPDSTFNLADTLSTVSVIAWYKKVEEQQYSALIDSLRSFRNKYELNDWLYYQLIRKVSESLVAKSLDYNAYTLYKWYFLSASGFDARLAISGSHLIFYILNEEEKRLSPEETLFSPYSDCDDRAGLFFYLMREIYDMPMIALLYPGHLTIAVAFERPFGTIVTFAGKQYTICEPTPQAIDIPLGASVFSAGTSYEVVYQYDPKVVR